MERRKQVCGDCIYWNGRRENGFGSGECLRFPPHVIFYHNLKCADSFFPIVTYDSWCGEWKEKDKGEG